MAVSLLLICHAFTLTGSGYRIPIWPEDFKWSSSGIPSGYDCIKIDEPDQPKEHGWNDNYLCWKKNKADPGMVWFNKGKELTSLKRI